MPDRPQEERLQKVLAEAGIGSRRQCERYITGRRVSVDGKIVTELGTKADPSRQKIAFDGVPIRFEKKVYFLLNKPKDYVCTLAEGDAGRRAVDLLTGVDQKLVTVGRLDKDSEGLIILTNDGELVNLLTHPRHQVAKTYWVKVAGRLQAKDLAALKKGVFLAEGKARASRVSVLYGSEKETILEVELRQGINRQIRRMFAKLDRRVRALKRIAIGGVSDPKLKPGRFRRLTRTEVAQLYGAPGKGVKPGTTGRGGRRRPSVGRQATGRGEE